MPMVVPIRTRKHKRIVSQSFATPLKRTVASESTNQKPISKIRKQYEQISKTCKWWYSKITPPRYKWKPKTSTLNVKPNLVEIILFLIDFGCSKHMTRNLKLLRNFVDKFLGTVKFGNDQIAPILGYGDLSTCYIRGLKRNDLLIGSRGTDLYSITLQDTSTPNLIYLMAKATSSQAWLWHRCLSHLNFDSINLLSKNDIVIGLPNLKFVKDHLCSSTNKENAQAEEDEFINIFSTPVQEREETSSHHVDSSNMHTFYQRHPFEHLRTEDHLLEQVIGNLSQSIRTTRQLEIHGEMCMFALTMSRTEPKNIREAMADSAWIEAMQEELHQFD
uniref:Uncharacterized protein n=1 Tax=Tanacetum cinerariifolium TaxID=118510 RepID=A0A699HSH2_TANCI|nr:hypothetical protein [Tanacetum cinerariifolium]